MRNIALSTVKKPKTLNTDQKAIWSGMWVISLGLFLIAGGEILSTYGCSLYSALVWGAVGLGPLLILTMLCGFNMSETREEEAFDVAISPRAAQFRQAGLRFRAGRQLQWSSLVRTPVIARVIPLAERHLQPGCDQNGLPGQPYLRASVPNLIFQAPIVALALIASSADVASADAGGFSHQFKIANTVATCKQTSDD